MNPEISVTEALLKGKRTVHYPAIAILLLLAILSIILSFQKSIPILIPIVCILLAFILPFLYWLVMITKWRLWAFESVRDVHELKRRAISEGLIGEDGSIYEKLEFRSKDEKEKWSDILEKFKNKDIFIDDFSIANETVIYFSKTQIYFYVAFGLMAVAIGIYLYFIKNDLKKGIFLLGVGLYMVIKNYYKLIKRSPQITISNLGLSTKSTDFYSWDEISDAKLVIEFTGKEKKHFLMYNHPKGSEKLSIKELGISYTELESLLVLYQGRFYKGKT